MRNNFTNLRPAENHNDQTIKKNNDQRIDDIQLRNKKVKHSYRGKMQDVTLNNSSPFHEYI